MVQWILQIMDSYGYLGMALLILGENLFPPIPSEVILTFGGFMTSYTKMHIPGAVLSATVGSVGGALILYQLGSLLTPERLDTLFTGRVGKILGLRKENLQKAADWFDSKGNYAVFFCRFIPIIRSLVSVPAGMAGMDLKRFLWMTFGKSTSMARTVFPSSFCFLAKGSAIFWQLYSGSQNRTGDRSPRRNSFPDQKAPVLWFF